MKRYILAIDQSTSGTKALLFDETGLLLDRSDLPHEQKISENGWVSHDPMEIWRNTLQTVKNLVEKTGIDKTEIAAVGLDVYKRQAGGERANELGPSSCSAVCTGYEVYPRSG